MYIGDMAWLNLIHLVFVYVYHGGTTVSSITVDTCTTFITCIIYYLFFMLHEQKNILSKTAINTRRNRTNTF
jgi:hypothetical protein